jgi:hypothetical protein
MLIYYEHTDFEKKLKKKVPPSIIFSRPATGLSPSRSHSGLWRAYDGSSDSASQQLATV